MIIEELNARDDFLLILAFRFLKYVKFTQEEKEVIFKSVLTHEFQAKRTFPMTLEELDQIILTKPDPTYRNVDEPKRIHELFPGPQAKIEKTKVLKLNTSDSEGEDDPKNKKKTANDSSDLSDSYEKERIESKLHKSIPIRTNFTLQKKDDELMDVEFYYKKKSVEGKLIEFDND